MFLHWWHHQVTGMYAVYRIIDAPRFTFVPVFLNFTVHAVMYSYYFLQTLQRLPCLPGFVVKSIKLVCSTIAMFITTIQTAQMAIALYFYPWFASTIEPEHGLDLVGIAMYLIYLFYFSSLFVHKYIFKTHKAGDAVKKPTPGATIVSDDSNKKQQ